MAVYVFGRVLSNWNDMGSYSLTDKGEEMYAELICKRMPDNISWCGDELLVELDEGEPMPEFDFNEAMEEAYQELCAMDDDSLWEEY